MEKIKMARPRKTQLGEDLVMDYPSVKQIVRDIAKPTKMPDWENGPWTIEAIDAYVGEWVDKGYDLVSTHYLGEVPEGYKILYVLKKLPG